MSLLSWFHALDLRALYLINQTWHGPWLDLVMGVASDWDLWKKPVAVAVGVGLIFGGFRLRLLIVMMAACLIIGDGLIDWGFKISINRPRPNETEPHLRVVSLQVEHTRPFLVAKVTESQPHPTKRGRSFTSGHACNNVALAMVGCAIFGRWALLLWPWAALVSYSRIYTASHYPSDILGSWIVAIAYSYFILKGASWLWRKYAPQKCPGLNAKHPVLFPLYEKPTAGTA